MREQQMTIFDAMAEARERGQKPRRPETQEQKIINYMKAHGGITPLEAMEHLHIMRLGARIFDLREKGYKIVNDPIPETNYARYKLMEDAP